MVKSAPGSAQVPLGAVSLISPAGTIRLNKSVDPKVEGLWLWTESIKCDANICGDKLPETFDVIRDWVVSTWAAHSSTGDGGGLRIVKPGGSGGGPGKHVKM